MKIAVNTRLLLPHKLEGIGWFTYEIFDRLCQEKKEVEWILIFDRPYDKSFVFSPNVRPVVIGPQARHPILWYLWFEWSITKLLRKEKPDLFISPDGYLSLKTKVDQLAVIHDINFEHHPGNIPGSVRRYYRYYFPRFAHRAKRIATVSNYSKQDIADTYGIDPAKIDLVYNGGGEFFKALPEAEQEEIRTEISGGAAYFVFIGALNPRKNITGMLDAFRRYKEQGGEAKFVIVGEKMFWSPEIEEFWKSFPYRNEVIFTGRLEGSGLNRVLASSRALVFVSNFEGFGIPIVEAFRCEVPVITSTTTSMPEVAGDAAILCDPDDHEAICRAMFKVEDPSVRNELVQKGRERAKIFTWDRSAEMMWDSIQKALR